MRILAIPLRVVGALLILLGIVLLRAATSAGLAGGDKFIAILVGLVCSVAGVWLYRFSRKLTAKTWEDVARRDLRPPILYLRSFVKDKAGQRASMQAGWKKLIYLVTAVPVNQTTQDEQMQLGFADIGPLQAVARPGAVLKPVGLPIIRIKDTDWKRKVSGLMHRAGLVVVRVGGDTDGLNWEIAQVFKETAITRILFLLPPSQEEYQAFAVKLRPVIEKELPEYKVSADVGGFSGLLYFTANGAPMIEGVKNSIIAPPGNLFNPVAIFLKNALAKIIPASTSQYEQVKISERAKAFLYDLLLILPISLLAGGGFVLFGHWSLETGLLGGGCLCFAGMFFFYPLAADLFSVKGTWGKRKTGIHLADKAHVKPTAQQIFERHVFRLFSVLLWLLTIIYTVIAWRKDLPLLHDLGSRTRMFRYSNPY